MTANSRPTERHALASIIGANALSARRAAGRTLRDVAASAGITETMLCRVEHGAVCPSVLTLSGLARSLDVPIADLFVTPAEGAAA